MNAISDAERDVATAGQLQRMLLPPQSQTIGRWSTACHYEPAGVVSGDYVDVMPCSDRLYFMLGDVSGKGVAASLLMAQLHAMFRTLIPFGLSLDELMTRASALRGDCSNMDDLTILAIRPRHFPKSMSRIRSPVIFTGTRFSNSDSSPQNI